MKRESAELREWVRVKRLHGLSDAHVQMARELGMNPKCLPRYGKNGAGVPLAQQIEERYLKRFRHSVADPVVPVRQLLREARARERAEARERRRRNRQSEKDHLDAMRVSMLTLRRMYGGPGAGDDYSGKPSGG